MKSLAILLCLFLFSIPLAAQNQAEAGYANTITQKEENGFPGFVYYYIQKSPTGKIYSQTYTGDIFVSGNNFHKRLDSLSRLQGGVGRFHFVSPEETWYFNSTIIAVLQKDSIVGVFRPEQSMGNTYAVKDLGLVTFTKSGTDTELLIFNGKELTRKKKLAQFTLSLENSFVQDTQLRLWRFENKKGKLSILLFEPESLLFTPKATYATTEPLIVRSITDEFEFTATSIREGKVYTVQNRSLERIPYVHSCGVPGKICSDWESHPIITRQREDKVTDFITINNGKDSTVLSLLSNDVITKITGKIEAPLLLGLTNNKPIRVIPYLKVFPSVLNQSGADIFALTQDTSGRIWAGSYKGGIAILNDNKVQRKLEKGNSFLNGSVSQNGFHYFIREYPSGGLVQISSDYSTKKLSEVLGYYLYSDRKGECLYYGTSSYNGIWKAKFSDLEKGKLSWEKIDSSRGIFLHNIITITEDKFGRIWAGHPRRGMSLYDPKTGQARTWLTEKKETPFGAYSSILSDDGTVWFGTNSDGLWYYNDYTQPASPASCKKIQHPLLQTEQPISGLTIYKNWLVMAATDRILLLNLDSFNIAKKVIMRYLNPGEHGFTGVTEQNAILVSKKDSTLWFSNTNMLYQWDIQKWLSLDTYQVYPEILLTSNRINRTLSTLETILESNVTSFTLTVNYSSPDLLPRYLSAALIPLGDSITLPAPSLKSTIPVQNIAQGEYKLVLEIYESDGHSRRYIYPITIRKQLWQLWWFWLLFGLAVISAFFIFISQKRKRQLAEAKALTKEAELNSYKAEQEKKLAQLQLNSLTNQFRPHFILNALNTIGAQIDDKPEAESVLSRLGESVNLIFNHAKIQKTLHPFENEWALVNNIIEIHRTMYLKELKVDLPDNHLLASIKNNLIPMGILQIPVENALLHGLNNKENGPWQLSIEIKHTAGWIQITISDNGIGREKSSTLSNFTKHGTGTKNLNEIISILNQYNPEKISVDYNDGIFSDGPIKYGTRVVINIPDHLKSEYA